MIHLPEYFSLDIEASGLDKDTATLLQVAVVFDNRKDPIEQLPYINLYCLPDQIVFARSALKMHPQLIEKLSRSDALYNEALKARREMQLDKTHETYPYEVLNVYGSTPDCRQAVFYARNWLPLQKLLWTWVTNGGHLKNLPDQADIPGALFPCSWPTPICSGRKYINVAGKNVGSFDIPFLQAKSMIPSEVRIRHRVLDPAILYSQEGDTALPDLKTCKERAGFGDVVSHDALDDALDVIRLLRKKTEHN
jgi:hypothetical protein